MSVGWYLFIVVVNVFLIFIVKHLFKYRKEYFPKRSKFSDIKGPFIPPPIHPHCRGSVKALGYGCSPSSPIHNCHEKVIKKERYRISKVDSLYQLNWWDMSQVVKGSDGIDYFVKKID